MNLYPLLRPSPGHSSFRNVNIVLSIMTPWTQAPPPLHPLYPSLSSLGTDCKSNMSANRRSALVRSIESYSLAPAHRLDYPSGLLRLPTASEYIQLLLVLRAGHNIPVSPCSSSLIPHHTRLLCMSHTTACPSGSSNWAMTPMHRQRGILHLAAPPKQW